MCVCFSLHKAILASRKIKIYIDTQLSESDINHNNEISGHKSGSMVQLLGRRKKEKLLRRIPLRPLTTQRLFCTCSGTQLSTESCAPPGGHGPLCREVFVWAHTDFPSLCPSHSSMWPCPQLSRCSVTERLGSWSCPW